jgi:hypothetical protein
MVLKGLMGLISLIGSYYDYGDIYYDYGDIKYV